MSVLSLDTLSDPIIEEALGLLWGALGFLTISYALSRALKAVQHGFSIRLQLFFTLFFASMVTTTLIGFWALQRIEANAILLFDQRGLSAEVVEEFMRDFGAKTGLIFGLLALICAGSAWALGKAIAAPIESLAEAAQGVSDGAEISSLPNPSGREVRRLREALLVMHEALEDRRQFERFIADLSHDLKNPVAGIQASIEVLQSGAAEDPEARAQFLGRVEEASGRLNRILSDFLGIARLEARGVRFDPQPLSIKIPILASINAAHDVAEIHSVSLVTPSSHPEILVLGSARWLSRAFDNLLANAIRYSPKESTIWVDWWEDEGRCLILVSDEGPGVSESLRAQVFNRFISQTMIHSDGKDHSGGTGLGLAIVKRIIEAHQGQVSLIDTQEFNQMTLPRFTQGAQFIMSLPQFIKT